MDFPRDAIEGSLSARFEAVVRRHADQPALRCDRLAWSYRDLNRCANLVACRLLPAPAAAAPVLLLLGHGALEIIALLAVLKSGRAYVALDPDTPPARLATIAADVGAEWVLTRRSLAPLAAALAPKVVELPAAATLLAAARDPDFAAVAERDPTPGTTPDQLASLAYTSGSTGTPKGVMRSHRCSLHRCWLFQRDHRVGAGDRIAHLFGCGFVAAEVDVYGALLNGGCLCCYPVRELGFGPLAAWLAAERITLLHPPPAWWRRFLDHLSEPPDLPALRAVFLAGEAVHGHDVARMRRWLPDCIIEHRLSSSESSAIARHLITPDMPVAEGALPVGQPVTDKEVLLLAADGRAVAPGEVGEIAVQSRYLSPGYWRQPALTASKFVAVAGQPGMRRYRTGDLGRLAPDGNLFHLGRIDRQVKIRGHRVEPGEIEVALQGLDSVAAAAVVTRPDPVGDPILVACLTLRPGFAADADDLRAWLARVLPAHLLPSRFEFHPALPLTANGKIDRVALAAARGPASPAPVETPPRGLLEEEIAGIWRTVLGLEAVDRSADFFALGGDSLRAAQVIAHLNREHAPSRALPLTALYQAPTIAGLAERAERARAAGGALSLTAPG